MTTRRVRLMLMALTVPIASGSPRATGQNRKQIAALVGVVPSAETPDLTGERAVCGEDEPECAPHCTWELRWSVDAALC